jgi:hypothetical protein
MSVARKILREKESEGVVVPYIREGGFVVYTTPSEIEKREDGAPIVVADALEEVASSVPETPVITDEMEIALAAASSPEDVKPSRLARKRREAGEKKERKDTRPEVVVEPLEPTERQAAPESEREEIPVKTVASKKPAPKKTAKKPDEKKAAPKKTTKKSDEKKPAPEKTASKAAEKKDDKKKAAPKKTAKKSDEKKPAPEKTASKAAEKKDDKKKAAPMKTAKKSDEKKPAPKKKNDSKMKS